MTKSKNKVRRPVHKTRTLNLATSYSLFIAWAVSIAIAPLVSPFFRSYIGSGGPQNQSFYGYTPDIYMASWVQVCTTLFILLWALKVFYERRLQRFSHPLFWGIVAFVGWASLSTSWSLNHYENFMKLSNWLAALGGLWLLLQSVQQFNLIRWLFLTLLTSAVLVSLWGIAQYLWSWQWLSQAAPPASTFGNKNFAAQYCLLCLPIAWVLFSQTQQRWQLWLYALSSTIIATYIIYTTTRAAWLGMILQLIIFIGWVIYERARWQKSILADSSSRITLFASLLVFIIAIHFNAEGFNSRAIIDIGSEANTIAEQTSVEAGNSRIPMWFNTLYQIRENLFIGAGIGNWYIQYPIYQQSWFKDQLLSSSVATRHTHNDLLQLTAELGLVGLLIILVTVFLALKTCWRLIQQPDPLIRIYTLGTFAAIAGLIVDSMFSSPLQRPMPTYLLVLFAGVFIWLDNHYSSTSTKQRHKAQNNSIVINPSLWFLCVLMAAALLVSSIFVHKRMQDANANYWKAKTANSQQDYQSTLTFSSIAYRQNSYRKRLLNLVGGSYLLLKNYPQAAAALEDARRSYPYMQHTLFNLSYAYEKMKNFPKAIEIMSILQSVQPQNASHAVRLGKLHKASGSESETRQWFTLALTLDDLTPKDKQTITSFLNKSPTK